MSRSTILSFGLLLTRDKVKRIVHSYIADMIAALNNIDFGTVRNVASILYDTKKSDSTIFLIGNGGSSAVASHMACDFNKGTLLNIDDFTEKRFRAISLTGNVVHTTAIGNDIGYENIFVEQLMNLARPGDVLIVISGSGNSPNLLRAVNFAKKKELKVIGLLGFGTGGECAALVDEAIIVQSQNYGPVEDIHSALGHILTCILRTLSQQEAGLPDAQISNKATPFRCPLAEAPLMEENNTASS